MRLLLVLVLPILLLVACTGRGVVLSSDGIRDNTAENARAHVIALITSDLDARLGPSARADVAIAGQPRWRTAGRRHSEGWYWDQAGVQVDLLLPHHAGLADVVLHPAVSVQQVHLNARVHRHQHGQQRRARRMLGCVAVGRSDFRPVTDDVLGQPMGQALQGLLLLFGCHLPAEQCDEGAIGQQQQSERQRQAGGERARRFHRTGSRSKR